MPERILVTGGAGFIGSHLVDALVEAGHSVRVLDNLEPQVHGRLAEEGKKPEYLNPKAEFICGDIRDMSTILHVLSGIDVVFHEAGLVGVGQSMYDIERYTSVNAYGSSVLLQAIVNMKRRPRKLIVASSMSIYGEGAYECPLHGPVYPKLRPTDQLLKRDWEMYCPIPGCKLHVTPCPTDENKPLYPTSIYAINKRDHEEMFLSIGNAYQIPTVALRYFNVYGPRQALNNPYTGVAAIFCSRLLNGRTPVIFEDGRQSRDFVHVRDIVQANLLTMDREEADYRVFNVGTGRSISVLEVARILTNCFQSSYQFPDFVQNDSALQPAIMQQYRAGDIRHCFPDISQIRALGYQPKVVYEEGVGDLIRWIVQQTPVDSFDQARQELIKRGLTG